MGCARCKPGTCWKVRDLGVGVSQVGEPGQSPLVHSSCWQAHDPGLGVGISGQGSSICKQMHELVLEGDRAVRAMQKLARWQVQKSS